MKILADLKLALFYQHLIFSQFKNAEWGRKQILLIDPLLALFSKVLSDATRRV